MRKDAEQGVMISAPVPSPSFPSIVSSSAVHNPAHVGLASAIPELALFLVNAPSLRHSTASVSAAHLPLAAR